MVVPIEISALGISVHGLFLVKGGSHNNYLGVSLWGFILLLKQLHFIQ